MHSWDLPEEHCELKYTGSFHAHLTLKTHTHKEDKNTQKTMTMWTAQGETEIKYRVATCETCRLVARSGFKHGNTSFLSAAIQLVVILNQSRKNIYNWAPWIRKISLGNCRYFNQFSLFHKIFHSKYKYITMCKLHQFGITLKEMFKKWICYYRGTFGYNIVIINGKKKKQINSDKWLSNSVTCDCWGVSYSQRSIKIFSNKTLIIT